MANLLRYGWPRWYLVRLCGWLPDSRTRDRMLNLLYPSDMVISFGPTSKGEGE